MRCVGGPRRGHAALLLALTLPLAAAQPLPGVGLPQEDLGPVTGPADKALGGVVPPALRQLHAVLGHNLTREDVRMFASLDVAKVDTDLAGLLVGSGKVELQAAVDARLEMRVISSDRIRAALQGEDAYNVSADNATFLSEAFLPAELFRLTATAQAIALFQQEQEAALRRFLEDALPEMEVLSLTFAWGNASVLHSLADTRLDDPPIVLEVDLVAQYIRVESVPSLVAAYFRSERQETEADQRREDYVRRLKGEHGDPLRSRDFFAAAAYTQLLNLSMQPGWSLELDLSVPRGYSFTYCNRNVEPCGGRAVTLAVDASEADDTEQVVFLASLTHKRYVALLLFAATWVAGLLAAAPFRLLHARARRRWTGLGHSSR